MVSLRVIGLAVYALALIVMGTYGYIVTTTAQPQYAANLCTKVSPGSTTLPNCLPSMTISETGSALMFPMFQVWASHFIAKYPNIQINTANTGSGQGEAFVSKGLVQIGGSAAYFTDAQIALNPSLQNFLNIPLAVTATLVEYNVPGIPPSMHLNFTATLLAQIYNTTIQYWDDPRIIAVNPGAASILAAEAQPGAPNVPKGALGVPIWPFYRSDAAADTLLFTQYLSTDPWWNNTDNPTNPLYPGPGSGLTVHWPACYSTETHPCLNNIPSAALGNPGIVIQAAPIVGSISYVSVEALDQWITPLGLHAGRLQNKVGNFVNATDGHSIQSALDALSGQTPPDERLSLINAPGAGSYPVLAYGYALVNKSQLNPDFATVLRAFLTYCILPEYGSSPNFLNIYHFLPLPDPVRQLTLNQIALIGP